MGVAGVGAMVLPGCAAFKDPAAPTNSGTLLNDPVIVARVTAPKGTAALKGTTVVYSSPDQTEEAFLYVPANYSPATPAPLLLMLHDENSTSFSTLQLYLPHADAAGLVLLAVDSVAQSWDIVTTGFYGPDVGFINAALAATFNVVNVDPARVAVEGFSNGAAYALAIGLTNGDLFSRVIAFAPAAIEPYTPEGKPSFFLAQGLNDQVYDITQTGRVLNQNLTTKGYSVDYVEFNGGHEMPDAIVQQSIAWLAS
jgi:phospholipase/carboxylesterase